MRTITMACCTLLILVLVLAGIGCGGSSGDGEDSTNKGMTTAEIREKGPEAARDMMKAKGMSKQAEMRHSTGQ